jgi:hypothetical protein
MTLQLIPSEFPNTVYEENFVFSFISASTLSFPFWVVKGLEAVMILRVQVFRYVHSHYLMAFFA